MFSFPKLTRRGGAERKKTKTKDSRSRPSPSTVNSPYGFALALPASPSSSSAAYPPFHHTYHHHHHSEGGSTVSLPTGIFGAAHSSNTSLNLLHPSTASTARPATRLANDKGSNVTDCESRFREARARARAISPQQRPSTFHELDPMLLGRLRGDHGHPAEMDPGVSPVALPQKALALLGLEERGAGFERPASPMVLDGGGGGGNGGGGGDDDSMYAHRDEDSRTFSSRDSDMFSEYTQKTYMGDTRLSRQTFKFTQLGPPPDRLYFRPQSLCSSFSTNSEGTDGTEITALTVITPTSPIYCGSPEPDQEGGTLTSESTIKGSVQEFSMLNLDSDTESDEEVAGSGGEWVGKIRVSSPPPPPRRTGELPLEISLQICSYFSQEAHAADLAPEERDCPNCNLHALHSLALTSRSWSAAATRTLYRIISLDLGSYDPATRTMTPFSTCTAECSGHEKDSRALHSKLTVEARLPLLYRTIWDSPDMLPQRIEGIKIPRGMFGLTRYPLSAILQKCPNLRFIDGAATTGSGKDLIAVLEPLTSLERWTWRKPHPRPSSPKPSFLRPDIATTLPSSSPALLTPPLTPSSSTTTPTTPSSTSATSSSSSSSFNTTIIPYLLTSWPRLHTLELEQISLPLHPPPAFPSSLHTLVLRHHPTPQIFNYLPPLHSLTVDSTPATDRLERYLSRHGSSLEILRIRNVDLLLQDVMSYIPNIQEIEATGKGVRMGVLREEEATKLRRVRVDTDMGLKEAVGWLVEASRRCGVRKVCVGATRGDEGGELGRLQVECMFNGVELVVGE